ncbi:MAG TPA: serine/threonine protein kinase [Casimicrobiaceae bacterium]|nr:serine/threonine protein kinase [Casimicrobiaceae bacterium]
MATDATPYAGLTPDYVLDALESVGIVGDGRLLSLNSYENRVYQCWRDDAPPVVAKFYRPGRWSDEAIVEEHTFTLELADEEIPAVPPLAPQGATLHRFGDFRFAVYAVRGGRAPSLDRRDTLLQLGRCLGRLHVVGAIAPFRHRVRLSVEQFGDASRDFLLHEGFLPVDLVEVYHGVADHALARVRAAFGRAGELRLLRLHGDCHVGNILWTDAGPHFVDFDDAMSGPAVQDLWMLLSGERAEMEAQLAIVLEGYETFRAFDRRELHLVEALRTLRLIHYAAWIARRWHDPAFPAAFPWFNTQRYWQDRILELREQIALLDEPPLAA